MNASAQVIRESFHSCGLYSMAYRFINRLKQSEEKCFEKSVSDAAEFSPNGEVLQRRADEMISKDIHTSSRR